ncbi:MAG: aldo/keto reductase [Patescibacteria group bacterium]
MQYNRAGRVDAALSAVGLGGHEFLPDGRVKAMGEEFHRAVTPGTIWEGFGGEERRRMLSLAFEAGINFFDLTMDSEKEAFGRNLKELPPPLPIHIQTRPEGMVYNNVPADTDKSRLLDYEALAAEARRGAALLGRERIDFYNFGLFPPAVRRRPDYVARLARNIERLKREGLILYACADTLSGEEISLEMIATGCFDAVFTNLSPICDAPLARVVPAARARGMAVFAREVFAKGRLFALGEEAGIADRAALARAVLRWVLALGVTTSVVLGVAKAAYLAENLAAAESPGLTADDRAILDRLRAHPGFNQARAGQERFFKEGFI